MTEYTTTIHHSRRWEIQLDYMIEAIRDVKSIREASLILFDFIISYNNLINRESQFHVTYDKSETDCSVTVTYNHRIVLKIEEQL